MPFKSFPLAIVTVGVERHFPMAEMPAWSKICPDHFSQGLVEIM
jgi:hypothetical protein